jgi:cyclopropane fatty-acyl-phospholipid synthase-like methyltransferase
MLAFTRKRVEGIGFAGSVDYAVADVFGALAEDVRKGSRFDLIVCLGLIAHTGRLGELLRLQRACLAPGGRILLQSTLLDHPGTRVVKMLTAGRYERQKGYAISYFTDEDIRATAQDCGLEVKEMRRYGVSVPFGDRVSGAMNLRLEKALASWGGRSGAEGLYLLGEKSA